MAINKDDIKESLTIEQVFDFVAEMGGEPAYPSADKNFFISKTICHNLLGQGSYKLYYYDNTKLFKCYTDCGDTFDIFELLLKIKKIRNEQISYMGKEGLIYRDYLLPDAIKEIAKFYNISFKNENNFENMNSLKDWEIFNKYNKNNFTKEEQIIEMKVFEKTILQFLPHPHIVPWEKEGISLEVMNNRGICYDPKYGGIVIPHYDINNNLVGIRERTLIKEEERYGKYKPAILDGVMYNHPLAFNLYNLNNSKDNIKRFKKVIVAEGEKFCLTYASYFGEENDITVAVCGSNLITYQVKLLLSLGVEEIIIAFDKQFQELGDIEWKKWTEKLESLHTKYGSYAQMSFLFDKENLLDYKDSPIDKGKEVFLKMFKERIVL